MIIASLVLAATTVSPADARITYVGRWDMGDKAAPACQWSACEVRFRLMGPGSVSAKIDEGKDGHDEWQVVIDDRPTQVLKLEGGTHNYAINFPFPSGRPSAHTFRLVRRTEPFVGTTKFLGLSFDGTLMDRQLVALKRHIEVVGDSITCGYGNEGANQNEHFKPETENAFMSYASIAARDLQADVSIIAWSGRKMWPNNTMPEIYDRVLPNEPTPTYAFNGPAPDAVVINLATNDFGGGNPDEAKWTGAYEAFIRRVWTHYPKAQVFCVTGSMMSDGYPPNQKALSTLTGYLTGMIKRMDDKRLHFLALPTQKMEDGYGSDWHPNVVTHTKMAAVLAKELKSDLGW